MDRSWLERIKENSELYGGEVWKMWEELDQAWAEVASLRQELAAANEVICGMRLALEIAKNRVHSGYCGTKVCIPDCQAIMFALETIPTCQHKEEVERLGDHIKEVYRINNEYEQGHKREIERLRAIVEDKENQLAQVREALSYMIEVRHIVCAHPGKRDEYFEQTCARCKAAKALAGKE